MADRISLQKITCFGYHGVLEEERRNGQTFYVDITCWLDFDEAAASDDLTKTVNYAELAQLAHDTVTGPPRDLIETVASEIADKTIARYEILHAVEVTIHKPHAPIPLPFENVSVVARRSRKHARRI